MNQPETNGITRIKHALATLRQFIVGQQPVAAQRNMLEAWNDDQAFLDTAERQLASGDPDTVEQFVNRDFRITSHRFGGYCKLSSELDQLLDSVYLAARDFILMSRRTHEPRNA